MINSDVPCNGCRACCIDDLIFLHPEEGDDVSKYETEEATHPATGQKTLVLKHKPNGECIYLGPSGCLNYENRPVICRTFDCRKAYVIMTKKQRIKLVEIGAFSRAKMVAAKKKVYTLTAEEFQECKDRRDSKRTIFSKLL